MGNYLTTAAEAKVNESTDYVLQEINESEFSHQKPRLIYQRSYNDYLNEKFDPVIEQISSSIELHAIDAQKPLLNIFQKKKSEIECIICPEFEHNRGSHLIQVYFVYCGVVVLLIQILGVPQAQTTKWLMITKAKK